MDDVEIMTLNELEEAHTLAVFFEDTPTVERIEAEQSLRATWMLAVS